MTSTSAKLFRAHSSKYLVNATGVARNPNLSRSRQPRDMPVAIHQILIEWFKESFGIDYRGTSLFCTGDVSIASGYVSRSSKLIAIEPIGDYSVCYSENCKDLFGYCQFNWGDPEKKPADIISDLNELNFMQYQNSGLDIAAGSGNEVMLVTENFRYEIIK